jgi:hypothetical protein
MYYRMLASTCTCMTPLVRWVSCLCKAPGILFFKRQTMHSNSEKVNLKIARHTICPKSQAFIRSRDILERLTSAPLDNASFPIGTHQLIKVAGHTVRALRVSFVGRRRGARQRILILARKVTCRLHRKSTKECNKNFCWTAGATCLSLVGDHTRPSTGRSVKTKWRPSPYNYLAILCCWLKFSIKRSRHCS